MKQLTPPRPALREAFRKAREKGLRESLELTGEIARARVARFSHHRRRVFVFISPPLTDSGAPVVLTNVVREFVSRYGPASVRLLASPVAGAPPERFRVCGVKVERAADVLVPSLVRLQLALRKDDFVLMNTVAVSRNYLEVVLDLVQRGRLAHAYWYIHEDVDHLPVQAPFLLQPDARSTVGRLMSQGRLTILVPSEHVKAKYDALLAWSGRRKEAAAYFAAKPTEFPFAFTKYQACKRAAIERAVNELQSPQLAAVHSDHSRKG